MIHTWAPPSLVAASNYVSLSVLDLPTRNNFYLQPEIKRYVLAKCTFCASKESLLATLCDVKETFLIEFVAGLGSQRH